MSHADYLRIVTEAHEAGKYAAGQGKPITDCPYQHSKGLLSPQCKFWMQGWNYEYQRLAAERRARYIPGETKVGPVTHPKHRTTA